MASRGIVFRSFGASFDSAFSGPVYIEQNGVKPAAAADRDSLFSTRRLSAIESKTQERRMEDPSQGRLVVDYKHFVEGLAGLRCCLAFRCGVQR
jgi:hypothetical protein